MKGLWWKLLGSILLLHVCVVGFMVPLGPGVTAVYPYDITNKETAIHIKGYHTAFKAVADSGKSATEGYNQAWLVFEDSARKSQYVALRVQSINNDSAILHFLPSQAIARLKASNISCNLVVNNKEHGTIMLPNAVSISNSGYASQGADSSLKDTSSSAYAVAVAKPPYFHFPFRAILYESIRNLFWHVPMWFSMMVLFAVSMVYSIKFLRKNDLVLDMKAEQYVHAGLLFAFLGLVTGSLWARFTWGNWWNVDDPKLNGAAILTFMYVAYLILRNSIPEPSRRAKVSAIYSIFAGASIIPLLYIYPSLNAGETLHPGQGGNVAFNVYDQTSSLRAVFYPAVLGFILFGLWIAELRVRMRKLELK